MLLVWVDVVSSVDVLDIHRCCWYGANTVGGDDVGSMNDVSNCGCFWYV